MESKPLSVELLEDRLTVAPGGSLAGEIGGEQGLPLPGDKSLSHRAALLGAMATGESRIENFLVSGVTHAMLNALTTLGVPWSLDGTTLTVQGVGIAGAPGKPPVRSSVRLDCGSSATTLRLLAGALAAWGVEAVLDGSPGLRRRPMGRIIEPLQQMGVSIHSEENRAPIRLDRGRRPLHPIDYRLNVASAQVKSCLLLAGLAAEGEIRLSEPGPSRDHTERMLAAMGVSITSEVASEPGGSGSPDQPMHTTRMSPPQPLQLPPLRLTLPGDMSAAAFLIVAALISPGSDVLLRGVGLNPTRTGLLDTLIEMGADIHIGAASQRCGEPAGDLRVRSSRLHGVSLGGERVVRMIDEFPVFAVAAACAEGRTVIADAAELRHKESDRISALGGELLRLGVAFQETPDGFVIDGGRPLVGASVETHGDHRLAMALAIAGLAAQSPVTVSGAGMIHESFPNFAPVLRGLGARVS